MSRLKNTLTAASIAIFTAPIALSQPPAWLVSDADSEMVLFPTVHALPDGIEWQSEALKGAIERADEVWTEIGKTNDPSLQPEIQKLIATYGMSPDTPLSSRLNDEQRADLMAALQNLEVPPAAIESLQPWLAALMLTQADLARGGIVGERGVEAGLAELFDDRPVRNLETAAQQTKLLAEFDPDLQIEFLMSAVESIGTSADRLREISQDWAEGDLSGMESELLAEMRADYPKIYAEVFTIRNQAWAELLDAELRGSGTDFVAVGAGHLLGDDAVQVLLQDYGYTVRQIDLKDAF
ncbi:MAG: TraB/GumN family protein [Pseudomonadota bacterium]